MSESLLKLSALSLLTYMVSLSYGCDDQQSTQPDQSSTPELDCRFSAYACAEGFSCEADPEGSFNCVPIELPPPEPPTPEPPTPELDIGVMVDQAPPARCGDGIRNQDSEECDDGNLSDNDGCLSSCLIARCGDGITRTVGEPSQLEECDDGNTNEGDDCLSSCRRPHCGDGIVNRAEEECDDGNSDQDDGCLNGCIAARCGDGFVRTTGSADEREACDDGNSEEGDDCLNSCEVARCGDGVINTLGSITRREQCDSGMYNGISGCTEECTKIGICTDECESAENGICEDGGYQSRGWSCPYGSDCSDCAPRISDTCREYPTTGVCLGESVIAACLATSGASRRELSYSVCEDYERCVEADPESESSAEQRARCELRESFSCVPGSIRCLDAVNAEYCDDEGQLQTFTCSVECVDFDIGTLCQDESYQEISGRLQHEYFPPNNTLSEWNDEARLIDAPEVLVISYVYDDENEEYRAFDVTRTGPEGEFTIKVAEDPSPNDLIYFWLAKYHEGEPYVALINPNFDELGEHGLIEVFNGEVEESAYLAGAARRAESVINAEGEVLITEGEGAGQFLMYTIISSMYDAVLDLTEYSSPAIEDRPLLAVWIQDGVDWECGACFIDGLHRGPLGYNDQAIFFSSNAEDRTYWSVSVVLHEFGHWVHSQFGTIPSEGGPHYFGKPTLPGQAWAEGFATLFGALSSGESIYYSKQRGSFFWLDLAGRSYHSDDGFLCSNSCESNQNGRCEDGGLDSVADTCTFGSDCSDCGLRSDLLFVAPDPDGVGYPDPDDPLLQKLDENGVASSLMKAFEAMIPERDEVDSSGPHTFMLLEMLQASEVNPINGQFVIPYARRYVRHSWTLNMLNDHEMIEAYPNEPTPSYPDFIDAFRCTFQRYAQLDVFGQFQSALNIQPSDLVELDRLIRPSLWTYPYPIEEPPPCR